MSKPIHDFEGRVRFLTHEEGGRSKTPMPGYRSDFRYENQEERNHWIVWPLEFFTEDGDLPEGVCVPLECFARFWILNPELAANYHKPRLKPGVKFEIYEGGRKVGTGEVTHLVGIQDR